MSFEDLLNKSLVIKRLAPALDGDGDPILDEYTGQPTYAPETFATVDGRIRPLTAKEVAQFSQAGAVVSTMAVDMWPLAGLDTGCWIECNGKRYDINTMPDAAGQGHHLILGVTEVG